MKCIYCGGDTKVNNSRLQKRSNTIWRRRKCLQCGNVISTIESINYESTLRVKLTDGKFTVFDPNILMISIYESVKHRSNPIKDASELTRTITNKILDRSQPVIEIEDISETTIATLKNFDNVASVHYSAFHRSSNG